MFVPRLRSSSPRRLDEEVAEQLAGDLGRTSGRTEVRGDVERREDHPTAAERQRAHHRAELHRKAVVAAGGKFLALEHELGMHVIALTGKGGGEIGELLSDHDLHLCVPAERTARIQETHLLTIHCLSAGIDALLLGVD